MNVLIKPAKIISAVFALLLLLLLAVLAVGIKIDLSPWRSTLTRVINDSLPYELSLDGDMEVRVSLRPSVHLTDIRLSSKVNPDSSIVTIGLMSAKVGVLPLLRDTVDIDHVQANDVAVHLNRDEQGIANWEVDVDKGESDQTPPDANDENISNPSGLPSHYQFTIDKQIAVQNLSFLYQDQQENIRFDGEMDDLTLSLDDSDNLLMNAAGLVQGIPWEVQSTTALNQHLSGQRGDVELFASLGDARVELAGALDPDSKRESHFKLDASIASDDLVKVFVGSDMTGLAPVSFSSQLTSNAARLSFDNIDIKLADSDLNGQLELMRAQPPVVNGSLTMNRLDLNPWLMASEAEQEQIALENDLAEGEATANDDQQIDEGGDEPLPLPQLVSRWLNSAAVNLEFKIHETAGLPVSVNNMQLAVKLSDGQLEAPMSVSLAGIDLNGLWQTSASEQRIRSQVELSAVNADVGQLMTGLMDTPTEGQVAGFSLTMNSQGRSARRLIRNAHLQMMMEGGRLLVEESEDWRVRNAEVSLGLARETRVHLDADLLSVPVNLSLVADPILAMRRGEDWNLDMKVDSPAFTASAKGFVAESGVREHSQFDIHLQVDQLGQLSSWLGVKPSVSESLRLAGQVQNQKEALSIRLSELEIGDSAGKLDIEWQRKEQGGGLARVIARLPAINVDQLNSFWPESAATTEEPVQKESKGLKLDVPLLANEIIIADADIDFRMGKLLVAGQTFKDLKFTGYIRDGRLKPSPLSAVYAGSLFYGDLALDLRQQIIESDFNLMVDRPDFGRILNELDVINDADIKLDNASFTLKLRGNSVAELIKKVELEANLKGGMMRLKDEHSGSSTEIVLHSGTVFARPNLRMTLKMDGELKDMPVTFEVSTNPLSRLLTSRKNVNMQLSTHINDMSFLSYAVVNLPFNSRKAALGLIVRTPSLDRLNPLLGVDMPPYGPITVNGRFAVTPSGYEMKQSKISVGDSHLTGEMALNTLGKPELDIQLTASSIQLDDFKVGDWQAWSSEDDSQSEASEEQADNDADQESTALISPQSLNRADIDFRLDVNEVLSGEDQLGAGKLYIQLQDGELLLNPLYVALPGGEVHGSGFLKPKENGFAIGLKANVDRLDYGVLARRVDPDTNMQGDVSFRMDLMTSARSPADLFSHAQGEFGFAVWPREFEAGIIDLWAVGLATAVLPRLGPSDPSQLNCAVGTFKLQDGQMDDNLLMLDTSKMQVLGHSQVDFTHEKINLVLVPRAKTAQIFGLSLPVMVSGSFNDFGFGVPSGELIVTTVRFITSPVIAPLRWILEQPLEEDGSKLCSLMYKESRNSPLK